MGAKGRLDEKGRRESKRKSCCQTNKHCYLSDLYNINLGFKRILFMCDHIQRNISLSIFYFTYVLFLTLVGTNRMQ